MLQIMGRFAQEPFQIMGCFTQERFQIMGRFAQESVTDGALRARVLIMGASRKNDQKNHSLKEERPDVRSSFNEQFFQPFLREAPRDKTLLREVSRMFDILARSASSVSHCCAKRLMGLIFGKLR